MIRPSRPNCRVFLVDDHAMVREHLAHVISSSPNFTVCGEASTAPRALSLIIQHQPDIVVTDLSMRQGDGFDLIKNIRAQCPNIRIVVCSMHDDLSHAERALRAGACAYVTKQESSQFLLDAIEAALGGETFVPPSISRGLISQLFSKGKKSSPTNPENLSDRELQVYERYGNGLGTRQISAELGVSTKTIDTHRMRICEKLGLAGMADLVRHATLWVESSRGSVWP